MHVLIGITIIVGLIAIGFGGGTARAFVRGVIYLVGFAVVIGFTVLVVAVVDELRPTPRSADSIRHLGKRGDISPALFDTGPLSNYATSCWKWNTQDRTMVPVGCDDADALTGPPGEEPRCGTECEKTARASK